MKKVKRIKYILICLLIMITGLLIYMLVFLNEGNQKSPAEQHVNEENSKSTENLSLDTDEILAEDAIAQNEINNKFTHQSIEYEFSSYEIIEDTNIATQTKYGGTYFYSGELPDPNELEEYRDTEAIKAESPELKDLWENNDKYTNDEAVKIFNDNIDIVNKHTNMIHIKTHYVFINCRLTNVYDKEQTVYINEIRSILTTPNKEQFITHDSMCYFDAAIYTQGDDRVHSFFCYTLQPGEVLNCTIGFQVKEEIENQEYYFGFTDWQKEEKGINPVTGKYIIKLSDLEEAQK